MDLGMNESKQVMLELADKLEARAKAKSPISGNRFDAKLMSDVAAALRASAPQEDGRALEPVAWLYEMAFYIKPTDEQPLRDWRQIVTIAPPPTIPKDGVRNVVPLYALSTLPSVALEALPSSEVLRSRLPTYVSNAAREIAGEAMQDVNDEVYASHAVYALARWFDALTRPQPGGCK